MVTYWGVGWLMTPSRQRKAAGGESGEP